MNDNFSPPGDEELRTLTLGLVEKQNTMTLCTCTNDVPWAAPVYYVNRGFLLYFFSDPKSRHILESQAAGRAAAAVFSESNSWQDIRGLQMSGEIKRLGPSMESLRAFRAYLKKFSFTHEFFDSEESLDLQSISRRFQVRFYCFKPDLLLYLDNRIRFSFRSKISL